VSAIAVVALRETKGIDFANIDLADSKGPAAQQDPVTRLPDGPEPIELTEGIT
jgi:hypothetical protein